MSKDILYKAKRVDNGEWVCGVIEFEDGAFFVTNRETVEMDDLVYNGVMECSVVGNIFDNPELLEK